MSRPVITKESQRYWLTFAAERVQRPLIWELGKKFDLVFDIRSGSVSRKSNGWLFIGCQSHPATLAVSGRLVSVTPWLKVRA